MLPQNGEQIGDMETGTIQGFHRGEVSKVRGTFWGSPSKDYSVLGPPILGSYLCHIVQH